MESRTKSVTILIISYDGFSDVWPLTIPNFLINWKNVNFPKVLLTNHKSIEGIKCIKVGEDKSWSDNLHLALQTIKSEYILTVFDDFYYTKPVDPYELNEILNEVERGNFNYMRLRPEPPPSKRVNSRYGLINKGALYRISLCTSIIKREVLLDLLAKGEDAWTFEFNGSVRSDNYDKFFATYKSIIPYINTIEKGKWTDDFIKYYNNNRLSADLSSRGVHPKVLPHQEKLSLIKNFILFRIFPPLLQRHILKIYQWLKK